MLKIINTIDFLSNSFSCDNIKSTITNPNEKKRLLAQIKSLDDYNKRYNDLIKTEDTDGNDFKKFLELIKLNM